MKRFRVIYGYPYFLKFLSLYTFAGYIINDGISFFDEYLFTDTGSYLGEQKISYHDIKSFAKIGKFTIEITLNKEFFKKVKKQKIYRTYFNKIIEESQAFYINAWNVAPLIAELESHNIKKLRDS